VKSVNDVYPLYKVEDTLTFDEKAGKWVSVQEL
jgi:hypothetical protein